MPITITPEDGSLVADANSYIDLVYARAFAAARGVTLSADDDTVAAMLIKATDYLETFDYAGNRVAPDQALAWPRDSTYLYGDPFPSTHIPLLLMRAQAQLVLEQASGIDLMPSRKGGPFVTVKKVDVIETHYSETISTDAPPNLPKVDVYLAPLLRVRTTNGLRVGRA